jgi:hypothetical protein
LAGPVQAAELQALLTQHFYSQTGHRAPGLPSADMQRNADLEAHIAHQAVVPCPFSITGTYLTGGLQLHKTIFEKTLR